MNIRIAIVVLLTVAGTFAQPSTFTIKSKDFYGQFWAAIRTTQELGKQGLRFTESRGDWVLTYEADRKGATRASYVHAATGVVDSECVVIGDSIYESVGKGPWKLRTLADLKAQQTARSAALKKARTEKDNETYKRIWSVGKLSEATVAATFSPTPFKITGPMLSFESPNYNNRVVTAAGRSTHNGNDVLLYTFRGTRTSPARPPRREGPRKHLVEADYWLDEKTGAIVKVRTMDDWASDVFKGTDTVLSEWEIDPSIAIKAPVVGEWK